LTDVALGDPDPDERADAISQLDLDDPAAMEVLIKALNDSDTDVRLAALDELWTNSDEPPLDILARVVHDPDPEVRLEAVRILSESEEPYAQQLLRGALLDRDEDVREEAADALDLD
jgi:HEAT repeat protein